MKVLIQTYFSFPISFKFIAEDIIDVLGNEIEFEKGDFDSHIPTKSYDCVFYIGSFMNKDVSRYYRYMFWTREHIYYGVTEGPPILSLFSFGALKYMKIIVPSEYVKWELENINVKVDGVVPHGIRIKDIEVVGKNNEFRRFIFGNKTVCLYVAHRNLRKGFKELIEAWKMTRASKDENVLLVLHTSSEPNRISGETEVIKSNGNIFVTEQILKLGRMDLYKLYKDSDVYIHGALVEGFGLPIIEAIACGLPTLTLDAKPMSEINRVKEARVKVAEQRIHNLHGFEAFRLNIPDFKDYAEKIDLMVYDKKYREEVREKQQEYIGEYDYKITYRKLLSFL